MIYHGYLICKKCGRHSDWGIVMRCPYCGCQDGEVDS